MSDTTDISALQARAEPTANNMSGDFGQVSQTCTAPRRIQFLYDDPLNTPVTGLLTRFLEGQTVLGETRSYNSLNFPSESGKPFPERLGVAEYTDLPRTSINVDTGDESALLKVEEEAWAIEKDIVSQLNVFETNMRKAFSPYIEEWNEDGWLGAGADFFKGTRSGLVTWWEGEKDFWGTAWGIVRSTSANLADVAADGLDTAWDAMRHPKETAQAVAGVVMDGADMVAKQFEALVDFIRGLLSGSIDILMDAVSVIKSAFKTATGAIGEFGQLISDVFENPEFLNIFIEVFRRTSVLGLIGNSLYRVITMMTPNYWAELLGKGAGFVLPEAIMEWIISVISALLAVTGVGAGVAVTALAIRATSLTSKLHKLIKGAGPAFELFMKVFEHIGEITKKLTELAKKLRDSIAIKLRDLKEDKFRVFTRYWVEKLDELAKQGHGPQRHEGKVTEKQLKDRSLEGFDPMTGTTVDYDGFLKKYGVAYDKDIHGIPPDFKMEFIDVPGKGKLPLIMSNAIKHSHGKHATKFNTPRDYVKAYEWVMKDPRVKEFESLKEKTLRIDEGIKLSDIFGPDFRARIRGIAKDGSPTKFRPDTKIIANFTKDDAGNILLKTMFPDP